jgi:hypothetical protein
MKRKNEDYRELIAEKDKIIGSLESQLDITRT